MQMDTVSAMRRRRPRSSCILPVWNSRKFFDDLPDSGPEPEDDDEYKVAIRKLDNHFKTDENIPYERRVFRQMAFNSGETTDQFATRLRKQARHCNFGANLDDNRRDQLIEQVRDLELKKRLLETKNITLEQALEKARAWETANLQARDMCSLSKGEAGAVNAVRQPSQRKKEVTCYNCGKVGHFKFDKTCPARGKSVRSAKNLDILPVVAKVRELPREGLLRVETLRVVTVDVAVSNKRTK